MEARLTRRAAITLMVWMSACPRSSGVPVVAAVPPPDAAVAWPALNAHWAQAELRSVEVRVACGAPDGGVVVETFEVPPLNSDAAEACARSPYFCATERARDELISQFDAATLPALEPTAVAHGRVDAGFPVSTGEAVFTLVRCGDEVWTLPYGLLRSVGKVVVLTPPKKSAVSRPEGEVLLIINPFTRQHARVTAADLPRQPDSLLLGAWATVEGARPARVKLPTQGWSALDVPLEPSAPGPRTVFAPGEQQVPASDAGVVLSVRLEARAPLTPRVAHLDVVRLLPDQPPTVVQWSDSHANGHDFNVLPGRYRVEARMPGAKSVSVEVEVRAARTEVPLTFTSAE